VFDAGIPVDHSGHQRININDPAKLRRLETDVGYPFFGANSLDDLMNAVLEDLLTNGVAIKPGRGPALERTGVLLELNDPRARLSRTETRGRVFSGLGELCWYMSGTSDAAFIKYYIPDYPGADAQGQIVGAYGPRLFGGGGDSQIHRITSILAKPDSRRAVVQIFDAKDLHGDKAEVPCTCTLQFLSRKGLLSLIVHMRSNDAYIGLTHDVFCFTMLQEIMASELSVRLGTYRHFVGSLHLYKKDEKRAREFLNEGWQTLKPMPPMPARPWQTIPEVLEAEATIRGGHVLDEERLKRLDPYWADIVRLLLVYRYWKDKDREAVERIGNSLAFDTYRPFVNARMSKLK
jgi:thymidylate synthase